MFMEALVIVSLALAVFAVVLLLMHQMYQRQQTTLMEFLERQSQDHQMEKERLMNRAMSRDWQTYAQLQNSQTSNLETPSESYKGMSDEEELRRAGYAGLAEAGGLGEEIYYGEVPTDEAMLTELQELGVVEP